MEWETFDFMAGRTKLDRKIGQILEGDRFRCSFCAGAGILHGNKGMKCPVCKGSGTVWLPETSLFKFKINIFAKKEKRRQIVKYGKRK